VLESKSLVGQQRPYIVADADSVLLGIDSRADGSIIRNNYIEDATGAGIRLGGHYVDGYQYGVNNQARDTPRSTCAHVCTIRFSEMIHLSGLRSFYRRTGWPVDW